MSDRRYLTVELRAITEPATVAEIDALLREALLGIRRLELGEIDLRITVGDVITINDHGFAVPLPAFPKPN